MNAFFSVSKPCESDIELLKNRRVLVAFPYLKGKRGHVFEIIKSAIEVVYDSGAFIAFYSGGEIRLDDYSRFLDHPPVPYVWALSLDVIGDSEKSLQNFRKMKERFPRIVPVFHVGEPIELLETYAKESGLIALAALSARGKATSLSFYDDVFNLVPGAKYHALGVSTPSILEHYPFVSYDSASWTINTGFSNALGWPFNRCDRKTRKLAYVEAMETIRHRADPQMRLFYSGI